MKFSEAAKQKKKGTMRKLANYFFAFDWHFERRQNEPLNLLEIGIQNGGSLFAWQQYFPQAKITGIDIDESCRKFEEGNIKVFVGDQADVKFLESVNKETGPYDIIIDDGGHTMNQQITSFKTLFPLLKDGGVYVIEDLHTSYWPAFFDSSENTVKMLKGLIDKLHWWAKSSERASHFFRIKNKLRRLAGRLDENQVTVSGDYFADNVASIHFYDSICFIYKGQVKHHEVHKI